MAAIHRSILGLAIALAVSAAALPADAQRAPGGRNNDRAEAPALVFPDATREAPKAQASSRMQRTLGQMIDALNEDDPAKARELADGVLANERANAYEKAVAAQVAGSAAADQDDLDASIAYFQRAIEENGLDNEGHYSTMQNLAVSQINNDDLAGAIETLKRLIAETRTKNPDVLYALAGAYFQSEQYAQAVEIARGLVDSTPEPKESWLKLLQGAYLELDQPAEAVAIGDRLLARSPDDKQLIFSQASAYLDLEQEPKAEALLQQARAKGLFTDARDYQALYAILFNMEGKEKDVIAVIEEGLAKGLLKRDLQTLGAMAQAAYFADDMAKSIATYKEAAALDPKGETGLNYAKVLSGEGMDAEAREAAKAALAKGVAKPGEAWMVIARSESQLDNVAGTRAALQEAAKFPETRDQATKMLQQNR